MVVSNGRGGARPGSGPKPKPVTQKRRNRVVIYLLDSEAKALRLAKAENAFT